MVKSTEIFSPYNTWEWGNLLHKLKEKEIQCDILETETITLIARRHPLLVDSLVRNFPSQEEDIRRIELLYSPLLD